MVKFAYYSITKENDNAFAYSDYMLKEIFRYEDYNTEFPEIYDEAGNLVVADSSGAPRSWRQDSFRRCRIRLHL